MTYASNCPISRPVILNIEEHSDYGGLSFNSKQGLFFASEDELLPLRTPAFQSYKPIVGG